jgi:alpha-amylase/alpha-mannosidase (GH57 family)
MTEQEKQTLHDAVEAVKNQMGPLVDVADHMLGLMSKSDIPKSIAKFISALSRELQNEGFTREEAIFTINSMDVAKLLKTEAAK